MLILIAVIPIPDRDKSYLHKRKNLIDIDSGFNIVPHKPKKVFHQNQSYLLCMKNALNISSKKLKKTSVFLDMQKINNKSSRKDFLLPLTPRSVPFGTPRFNSNNNLNN